MSDNNQQATTYVPPVFMSVEDVFSPNEKDMILKGPWEKKDTIEFFQEEFENKRIGASANPLTGKIDWETENALRASPGNVEVGLLFKKGNNKGWEDVNEDKFVNSASLFLDSPYTLPTIHAPVDINWMGFTQTKEGLKLSDDVRKEELNWLKKEIPNKVIPFINVIEIKKELGYIDKDFKIPIVFHSTPEFDIYKRLSEENGEEDVFRINSEIIADEKTGSLIPIADLKEAMKNRGLYIKEPKNYAPVRSLKDNIEKDVEFHNGLVEKYNSIFTNHPIPSDLYKKEDFENTKDALNKKNKFLEDLSKEQNLKIKKSISDSITTIKKIMSEEKLIEDFYKDITEVKDSQILTNNYMIDKKFNKFINNLNSKYLVDFVTLSKLESKGINKEDLEELLQYYKKLNEVVSFGTKEEIEDVKNEIKKKIKEIYKSVESARKFIIPTEKEGLINQLKNVISDVYKRAYSEEDAEKIIEEIDKELKDKKGSDLYNVLQDKLEKVIKEVENKELVKLRPAENVAIEKASDTIAEFAKELVLNYPKIKDNAFIAIENFFPGDFFGGKVVNNGKVEWAMKVLLEKSREKLKEKLKKYVDENEAEKISKDFIAMTLDMGHFNLWRSEGNLSDEEFKEMATDFVNSVKPFVRHVHLTDNPGTADTHQEIGTGNVENELAIQILKEEWKKENIKPTMTIEWGGPTGLLGMQPSNYENWRLATMPAYASESLKNVSSLYKTFSTETNIGFYYKDEPYLTSWLG